MNGLREFHGLFEGRRLEFRGEAVKHTTCWCCHQSIAPEWRLKDISGGPYDAPEGTTEEDRMWCSSDDGGFFYYDDSQFGSLTLDETDALPKEQGRVSFTAMVGFCDREPGLDKIEFTGRACPPEVEPPWATGSGSAVTGG